MITLKKSHLSFISLIIILLSIGTPVARAQLPLPHVEEQSYADSKSLQQFKEYISYNPKFAFPSSVVDINIDPYYPNNRSIIVVEDELNLIQNYILMKKTNTFRTPYQVFNRNTDTDFYNIHDGSSNTYEDFELSSDGTTETIELKIVHESYIKSKQLTIDIAENVILPQTIEITTDDGGNKKIILAETQLISRVINFPETQAQSWTVKFTISQPLRIQEISFVEENPIENDVVKLRFVAKSDKTYKIYLYPDELADISPNIDTSLSDIDESKIIQVGYLTPIPNPNYVVLDTDGDTISDKADNCPQIKNFNQDDNNKNNIGDACEDFDGDGFINASDNCPDNPNANQSDQDRDEIGDLCDTSESRFTEKYPWLPWVGMIYVGSTTLILLVITLRKSKRNQKV